MKVLHVAEKPSVAKEISRILSNGNCQTQSGYSRYNPVYHFQGELENQSAEFKVTSVCGHVMEIDFAISHRSWNSCSPLELFKAPIVKQVKKDEMNGKIVKTIEREIRNASGLVLWLDCDREGENIAFEVIEICKRANGRLGRIYRARFSALIPRDIRFAMGNLNVPDVNMSYAVDARSEIDLRLGAAFTRFQTKSLGGRFHGLQEQLISYGSCQFPTLGFVVERYLLMERFKKQNFWTIVVEGDGVVFHWERNRLFDRFVCVVLYEMVVEVTNGRVSQVIAKENRKYKPVPLATVELQKKAANWLRMPSEVTMKIAEQLYNKGMISYPRTETEVFKKGTDLNALIQLQVDHDVWGDYANDLCNGGKFEHPKSGKHDDNAHPPIHPTKCVHSNSFSNNDEKKLYELITRHFLACCSRDAKGHQTKVTLQIGQENFHTSGQMVLEKNYLDIYKYESWSNKTIPVFRQGDPFVPKKIDMTMGETTPPTLLTEAELIAAMDRNGIGTDATIAEHINTIQKRKYAVKVQPNRLFKPTELGLALIQGYADIGYALGKPHLRAAIESDCSDVAAGRKTKQQVVDQCMVQMEGIFRGVCENRNLLEEAMGKYYNSATEPASFQVVQANFTKCGTCEGSMSLCVHGRERVTTQVRCEACAHVFNLPSKGNFEAHTHICPKDGFQVIQVVSGEGYTGNGYTLCPKCFGGSNANNIEDLLGPSSVPCFKCDHSTCTLAGGQPTTPVMQCPQCHAQPCTLRKTRNSKWMVGCQGYPTCTYSKWLPNGTMEAKVDTNTTCNPCFPIHGRVQLVTIQFKPGSMPPNIPLHHRTCILCDELLQEFTRNTSTMENSRPTTSNTPPTSTFGNSTSNFSKPNHVPNNLPEPNILCNCQLPVHERTTTKEGPNKGRLFYSCPKPRNESCGYFQWKDESTSSSTTSNNTTGFPNCKCNLPSVSRTVRAQGANTGRNFYTCSKSRELSCGFFEWTDNSTVPTLTTQDALNTTGFPNCKCNLPSVSRTVRAQGANTGRNFYTCSKSRELSCGFFEWVAE